jgi:hypothetical protein
MSGKSPSPAPGDAGTGAASSAMFAALSVPNFRRYVAGQSLSLIGTWVETVAQALLVLHLTHSGNVRLAGSDFSQALPDIGQQLGAVHDVKRLFQRFQVLDTHHDGSRAPMLGDDDPLAQPRLACSDLASRINRFTMLREAQIHVHEEQQQNSLIGHAASGRWRPGAPAAERALEPGDPDAAAGVNVASAR